MDIRQRTLNVDWKSSKHRDMRLGLSRVTLVMLKCLTALLRGDLLKFRNKTVEALRWRDLVDEYGALTSHGRALALLRMPLDQQCEHLQIELNEWQVPDLKRPEKSVIRLLSESGVNAEFVENSMGLFIDFLTGQALVDAAEKVGKRIYTLNPPYDLDLFWAVSDNLEEYLGTFDCDHCLNSLTPCEPYLSTIIMEETPAEICERFDAIYRSLGLEHTKALLRMYFSNPHAYNYRGWPDIFVHDPAGAYFIEVKTTDRLNLNQIVTIPDLKDLSGIPVKIVRLNLKGQSRERPSDSTSDLKDRPKDRRGL